MLILHRCGRRNGAGGGEAGGEPAGEGWQAVPGGGMAGGTPPLMVYEGTISGFSLQKFFFGFRMPFGCVDWLNYLRILLSVCR